MNMARDYNAIRLKENFQLRQRSGGKARGEIDERSGGGRRLKVFQVLTQLGTANQRQEESARSVWKDWKRPSTKLEEHAVIHRFLLSYSLLYLPGFKSGFKGQRGTFFFFL